MESLYNKISKSVLDTLNKQLKDVSEELSKIKEPMEFMNAEFEECKMESLAMKKSYKELQDENCKIKSVVQELTIRVNQLDQSARSSNSEIQCVPERKSENVLNIFKDKFKDAAAETCWSKTPLERRRQKVLQRLEELQQEHEEKAAALQ
ncbi:unnamed protein product [Parnassius apollo]|uniref:(apollo) hypothetical protein n=1 Tax=Parnassius apollo TaxID=110799 RepID=A0A8S3X8S7_PARAO|nr:unnamed protein product [Parnassius apollo]